MEDRTFLVETKVIIQFEEVKDCRLTYDAFYDKKDLEKNLAKIGKFTPAEIGQISNFLYLYSDTNFRYEFSRDAVRHIFCCFP